MLKDYFGILAMFLLAGTVCAVFIFLSEKLGPKKPNFAKNMPFECGKAPFETPAGRHSVKFYLDAMLFVLCDIEMIFFFPWAVVYRTLGAPAFFQMMFFIAVLVLGFGYAWKKGALEWK